MFTGIVKSIGIIKNIIDLKKGKRFRIYTNNNIYSKIGSSISCDGVCLTVIYIAINNRNHFYFDVEAWQETLNITTLINWKIGNKINIEYSLTTKDEIGGHIVSGHIDGTVKIIDIEENGMSKIFTLKSKKDISPFIILKGSVCLNGTSLTVNYTNEDIFKVLIINHTLKVTTWNILKVDDYVNIEIDLIARYVINFLKKMHIK